MANIVAYFNSLLSYIFGSSLSLYTTSNFVGFLGGLTSLSLEEIIIEFITHPSALFSAFVWFWFAWFSIHLLLIWPFNWFRSIIRKCKG